VGHRPRRWESAVSDLACCISNVLSHMSVVGGRLSDVGVDC
jgi:hypothetical protein